VAGAAIVVGMALEVLKYINLLTWPLLRAKLSREYGPFVYSASIVIWSFFGAMLVLAGAEWSARGQGTGEPGYSPATPDIHKPERIRAGVLNRALPERALL
jgi:uncharacterized BrkB/YihY/UPF0761 family membrane protein